MTNNQALSGFFDTLEPEYDTQIRRGCPPYDEFLTALLDAACLEETEPYHFLELGCGTGNLTLTIAKRFPNSRLTVLDFSAEMLLATQRKLQPYPNPLMAIKADFLSLALPSHPEFHLHPEFQPPFDGVFSALAIHHLQDDDKQKLYDAIFQWLKPGASFWCADQCLAVPVSASYQKQRQQWRDWCSKEGASEAELALWEDHARTEDHYAPLYWHLQALSQAGFESADCTWRTLFWTVFGGRKPEATP
jgi:tRNA (cmo5U34)-methyltransferase